MRACVARSQICSCKQDRIQASSGDGLPWPSTSSRRAFLSLLKQCIGRKSSSDARKLHADLTHLGLESDALIGNLLVVALGKCKAVDDAVYVSCRLPSLSNSSWEAIVCAHVECSRWLEAFDAFKSRGNGEFCPGPAVYASIFKACGNLEYLGEGRISHSEAVKRGFTSKSFLGNTLVSMYGKCGVVMDAETVFCMLTQHSVVSWTAILSVYLEQSQAYLALRAYRQMIQEGVSPNMFTMNVILKACNILASKENIIVLNEDSIIAWTLEVGRALHSEALQKGFASNLIVCTALLCLYDKCGVVAEAENAFESLVLRDVAMWNSMISAYKNQDNAKGSLLLYLHMLEEGFSPNELTFVITLEACSNMAKKDQTQVAIALDIGRGLHCDVRRMDYMSDTLIGTALLHMYGKCEALIDLELVFDSLPLRNIVSWTAMLFECINQGETEKAISLYNQMHKEDFTFDDIIFLAVLQMCGDLGCLDSFRQVHTNIVSVGYDDVPFVRTSLIHGYGRCASMHNGQAVFASLAEPNLESWNACIAGHAATGNLFTSIHVYDELRMSGTRPDEATYTPVLSVCSHSGSIMDNFHYLRSMSIDYGLRPDGRHYVSTADLWGRAGHVKDAFTWLNQAPVQTDPAAWSSFLGACRIHGNVDLAKVAFEHVSKVLPEQVDAYVTLSNLCAFDCGEVCADYN